LLFLSHGGLALPAIAVLLLRRESGRGLVGRTPRGGLRPRAFNRRALCHHILLTLRLRWCSAPLPALPLPLVAFGYKCNLGQRDRHLFSFPFFGVGLFGQRNLHHRHVLFVLV
jgi:hypothetical protein